MISRSAEYAIRSLAYMATAGERWVLNREIAAALDLPSPFLTKLLGTLAREGLLESQRGRSGGFRLARAADQIRLLEIVDPFDRLSDQKSCILGRKTCSDRNSCALHASWRSIQDEFQALFTRTTLADVADGAPVPKPGARRR